MPATPHLVIDLTIAQANIDRTAAWAKKAKLTLRPHVKTHKSPEIARLQRRAGAVGITVATIGEAEVFARSALVLKYDEPGKTLPITESQILRPRRFDDNHVDLWSTFNRVQENLVKGGLSGRSANGRQQNLQQGPTAPRDPKPTKEHPMKIRPLYDRILVKRIETKEQVRGGIIIPDTAKEKPMEATVEAVGEGKFDDNGKRVALTVKTGDKVLIGKYAGTEIKLDDQDFLILREDEVLAIVDAK